MSVDYAPVQFKSKDLTLWLPRSAESFSDFETYRLVVKHGFSDFLLSSVQAQQVIGLPSAGATGTAEGTAGASQKPQPDRARPNVEVPLRSPALSRPCSLLEVLEKAGARSRELVDNLQSFTARDTVRYEQLGSFQVPNYGGTGIFSYAVNFEQSPGWVTVTEVRTPVAGGTPLPLEFQDSGLPAIALIFHPYYQGDYDMRCEGLAQSNGELAWVIHFEQRKDKPSRTRSFRIEEEAYPAALKGRGWISVESNQIVHIETTLVAAIPTIHLRSDKVKVDYAPVQFKSKNLMLWLPRSAESRSNFGAYWIVIKENFSDFLLSSVHTQQVIGEPSKN
jgi:hypothetical protein